MFAQYRDFGARVYTPILSDSIPYTFAYTIRRVSSISKAVQKSSKQPNPKNELKK